MKDRYLFRGKRKDNGEWIFGNLIQTDDGVYIIQNYVPLHLIKNCEVDQSTVCQCTGRKDKNGKLIYENDIMVAYYDEENPEHGTYVMVVWREYGWVTVENNSDDLCPLDDFTINHFYVVGNIFDNPELLEV